MKKGPTKLLATSYPAHNFLSFSKSVAATTITVQKKKKEKKIWSFRSVFISQPAHMMPRCSGLKKQKTDACVIKTIKAAAVPSAVVRDCSNEQKKESKRDFFGY